MSKFDYLGDTESAEDFCKRDSSECSTSGGPKCLCHWYAYRFNTLTEAMIYLQSAFYDAHIKRLLREGHLVPFSA